MRTTLRLDPEVTTTAERLRRGRHIGLGEAISEPARAGLTQKRKPARFRQWIAGVRLRVDATDIAGTLELFDQCNAENAR